MSLSRRLPVAAALLLVLAVAACKKENTYVPPPPPPVDVAKPAQQLVMPYLEVTGNATPYNQVDLEARVQGYLTEIDYQDGAMVKQADTLFIIEPGPYQAQLQQAQATLASTQADLVQAQAEFYRQSTLGKSDFASQSAVDQARAKRDSDQAKILNDQAGVTLAAITLGYTRVTAPFDGQVSAHLVSQGGLVGVAGPTKLATITQLDPIYALFTISEQQVLRIKQAMRERGLKPEDVKNVPVEVALMTDTGYPHVGTLDYVAPTVDASTGTLTARGILKNPDRAILPGMFLRIRIPMQRDRAEALLVPDQALGADQAGRYLLIVDKDNVVQQKTVQVGQLEGSLRVITSGLSKDDLVVVTGIQRAIPGEKVSPQMTTIKATPEPPPPVAPVMPASNAPPTPAAPSTPAPSTPAPAATPAPASKP